MFHCEQMAHGDMCVQLCYNVYQHTTLEITKHDMLLGFESVLCLCPCYLRPCLVSYFGPLPYMQVLVRVSFGIDTSSNVAMKVVARSEDPELSELIN